MSKVRRTLQLAACLAILSASFVYAEEQTQTRETAGQYLDDSVMTTKVKAAIFGEESLKSLQINVKTYKGQAQLSGFVDSEQNATRAGEVARSVAGVASVKNDLIVK
jgi:osmotically-inducible protein OsmY